MTFPFPPPPPPPPKKFKAKAYENSVLDERRNTGFRKGTCDLMLHLPFTSVLRSCEMPRAIQAGLVGFSVNITAPKPGDLAVRRTQEVERELQESEAGFVPPVKSAFQ